LRFAFGTLTAVPVRLTRWDRSAARAGMAAAPLVGAAVGLCAAVAGGALLRLGASPLLAAVAAVAVPAALTRGLHLDGLADTADGLGSGKPAPDALRIMKQSDVGPFGVVVLVLVLLGQVAALAGCYGHGWRDGGAAAVVAGVAGRTAMTLACRRGGPAARPDGLGAAVASCVPPPLAVAAAAVTLALGAALATWHGALAAAAALLAAELLLRRCTRRFGGVTGDVFGALEETACTCAYLILTLR
jgi:adenosylcobinamide-GDP ribazoletransferase